MSIRLGPIGLEEIPIADRRTPFFLGIEDGESESPKNVKKMGGVGSALLKTMRPEFNGQGACVADEILRAGDGPEFRSLDIHFDDIRLEVRMPKDIIQAEGQNLDDFPGFPEGIYTVIPGILRAQIERDPAVIIGGCGPDRKEGHPGRAKILDKDIE
jgi:hypothetical protein